MSWHYQLHTKHFNYDNANFAAPSISKRIENMICQLSLFFENPEPLSASVFGCSAPQLLKHDCIFLCPCASDFQPHGA